MACLDRWFIDDVASNEEAQGLEIFSRAGCPDASRQASLPTLRNDVVQGILGP